MPRQAVISAWLGAVLALLFYIFFQLCKQQPDLARVNPFANDPYDATGSFAVQFALLAAVVSLIRALRRYSPSVALEPQRRLLARGLVLTWLTVAITLIADAVALLRYPSAWTNSPAGHFLAALVGVMAVLTLLVAWLMHVWTRTSRAGSSRDMPLAVALAIFAATIAILALYPEAWRQSTHGAILTVLAGTTLLFIPLWALGLALSPAAGPRFEDTLDDLASMYRYLRSAAEE